MGIVTIYNDKTLEMNKDTWIPNIFSFFNMIKISFYTKVKLDIKNLLITIITKITRSVKLKQLYKTSNR